MNDRVKQEIDQSNVRKNALLFQQRQTLNDTNSKLKDLVSARNAMERKEFVEQKTNYHLNF
jgi:hypothetical protein